MAKEEDNYQVTYVIVGLVKESLLHCMFLLISVECKLLFLVIVLNCTVFKFPCLCDSGSYAAVQQYLSFSIVWALSYCWFCLRERRNKISSVLNMSLVYKLRCCSNVKTFSFFV